MCPHVFIPSRIKEQCQNKAEIQKFDGKAVRPLIDFICSGKIVISIQKRVKLLSVVSFLQTKVVKQFCFELLENNLSIKNCLEMVNLSNQYNCLLLILTN